MHCNTINNSHGVGLGTTISRHVPVFFFTPHTAKHNQNRGLVQLKQRIFNCLFLLFYMGGNHIAVRVKVLRSGVNINETSLKYAQCTHYVLCPVDQSFIIIP